MANETKRTRTKKSLSAAQPRSYSELYKGDNTVPAMATPVGSNTAKSAVKEVGMPLARGSDSVNWQKEYAHVIHDVRSLLLVSGVLFALIIVAGFFV